MSEVRCYREMREGYYAARIETWAASGPPTINVFAFGSLLELIAFEEWIDATIAMLTRRKR